MNAELRRLREDREKERDWRLWGPYLSERQWGTVREDYSEDGNAWAAFPHDQARSRAYRWGEDGLMGWSDKECRLCFAPAVWNGRDPILKERLFGVGGNEGNHGEDVKECYYYLESTPTHSYTKCLYKYPQCEYPYIALVEGNGGRSREEPELELEDLGVFEEGRYFDVSQEVAKRSPEDLLWKITVTNHGPEEAVVHVLPTVWFRNTWSWGDIPERTEEKPWMRLSGGGVEIRHETLGGYRFESSVSGRGGAEWLFTENETNEGRLTGGEGGRDVKDSFHRYLVEGEEEALSGRLAGTKVAAHWKLEVPAGGSVEVRCRLYSTGIEGALEGLEGFDETFGERAGECDEYYGELLPGNLTGEEFRICRQGYAGLLWTKQYFQYSVKQWMDGDPEYPAPAGRGSGRNADWRHFHARDILSMPDKWEYPWFAAWDTAFHMVPFAVIDPEFAKGQLLLLLREWYMHPNGQLPAYEWNFSDVNPPVHAAAVYRVFKIADRRGHRDLLFLERAFQKLLINFTWWVNRKDVEGRHVFGGGFLGLDNIGVFDRSQELPGGGRLNQADGTAWMAGYCQVMLAMALELAQEKPAYEDIASKFFEHLVRIIDAINRLGGTGLWDVRDGFYYDQLIIDHEPPIPLRIRSLVGLLPLCAVSVIRRETIDALPDFRKRMDWFLAERPDLSQYVSVREADDGGGERCMLAIPTEERLRSCLRYLLDEEEFLARYGIRSLSKVHEEEPFVFDCGKGKAEVRYTPGESDTSMFGGNSNWRGPIWFPANLLILEALERYYYFYGDGFTVEYPTGSGEERTLREVSIDLCDRLISIFLPGEGGERPCFRGVPYYADQPDWKGLLLFHEYFHGETGKGLGASHQTGWTSVVVKLVRERREKLLRMGEK